MAKYRLQQRNKIDVSLFFSIFYPNNTDIKDPERKRKRRKQLRKGRNVICQPSGNGDSSKRKMHLVIGLNFRDDIWKLISTEVTNSPTERFAMLEPLYPPVDQFYEHQKNLIFFYKNESYFRNFI